MLESEFKKKFKDRLKTLYPDCILINVRGDHQRSFPDLMFVFGSFWAAFETKKTDRASKRPNQEYWVDVLDSMSFSRFVEPTNVEEVFRDLAHAIRKSR